MRYRLLVAVIRPSEDSIEDRRTFSSQFFPGFAHHSTGDRRGDRLFNTVSDLTANLGHDALRTVTNSGGNLISDGGQNRLDGVIQARSHRISDLRDNRFGPSLNRGSNLTGDLVTGPGELAIDGFPRNQPQDENRHRARQHRHHDKNRYRRRHDEPPGCDCNHSLNRPIPSSMLTETS